MTNEELLRLYKSTNNKEYLDSLYKQNYKLITSIVTKRNTYDYISFSWDDYISECNIAFVKCVIAYSDESSAKFSSVAYQYMNNACKQLIRRNNMKKRLCIYDNIPIHSNVSVNDKSSVLISEIVSYDEVVFPEYQSNENELYDMLKSKAYRKHVEILDLLNEGYSQKEIAIKLGCSHQKISASVKAMRLIAIENGFVA